MTARDGEAMRFHRGDIPGLLIAVAGPVGLTLLFLASFDAWDHHGTPLLGAMAANIAIGGGLLAAFARFIRSWDLILGLLVVLVLSTGAVIWLQQIGDDGTDIILALKWVAVIAFLALNILIPVQYITNGLIPWLNRRDAQRAAESES